MKNKYTFIILYIIIAFSIAFYCFKKPDYNWDTLPYVASVYSLESNDTNTIHKNTYETVKNSVPHTNYEQMVSSNQYRIDIQNCARCFYQQLPFYKIRPLYIFLTFVLYKLDINIVSATVAISSLSCFFIFIILFLWIKSFFNNEILSFIISICISVSPYILNSASEASPNALSGLIIIAALYSLFKKRTLLFLVLMLLSILARPDNLLLVLVFSSSILIYKNEDTRKNKIYIYLTIILSFILFLVIDKWSGNYSWAVLFEHSFYNRINNPAEYVSHLTPAIYFNAFIKWAGLFKNSFISIQIILLVLVFYIKPVSKNEIRNDIEKLILIAAAVSILIHYLFYPVMEDKLYIAQYFIIDIVFLKTLCERYRLAK